MTGEQKLRKENQTLRNLTDLKEKLQKISEELSEKPNRSNEVIVMAAKPYHQAGPNPFNSSLPNMMNLWHLNRMPLRNFRKSIEGST